ncbi:ABC transporter permease [Schleiferilactobacillus shenzhenensis]|uniref:MacB-like periplasmic core domain-containing protein n=1 Tax=Schleiferilactobacillus shenzhenensis LY-73 TaxID=1231336 RepID=U4TXY6_9LACO|nr:ABC transporter permease [Schleiferilactobacillus shenzhenensis]ERL66678.1 hypothetical protein L248_0357 [Schleiferilactobacillus shenzhenensis LY-73]
MKIKKKLLLLLGNFLAFFLIVWAFSINDQQTYQDRLNRNGLSADALRVHTKSRETIPSLLTKLSQSGLTNYQVQITAPAHKSVTYVFAAGNYTQLPISSGRMLGDTDFSAPVPFVVVGDAVTEKLYQPANQKYYDTGNRYLSVVGTVGAAKKADINNHVFISLSTDQSMLTRSLRRYTIYIDGTLATTKQKTAKKLFQASRFTKAKYTVAGSNGRQVSPLVWTIAILAIALLLLIGLARAFVDRQRQLLNASRLDRLLYRHLQYGYIRQYFLYGLVGMIAGYVAASSWLYLLSYHQIFVTAALFGLLQAVLVVTAILRTKQRYVLTEAEEDAEEEEENDD